MNYPGRAVRRGDSRRDVVRYVQTRLNTVAALGLVVDGDFGPRTEAAVRLYQARLDLQIDGVVGQVTWAALHTQLPPTLVQIPTAFAQAAVEIALAEVGVKEMGGNNRGPRVAEYLASVGLKEGQPWCMAFLYWTCVRAALRTGQGNALPRTGHVHTCWERAPAAMRLTQEQIADDSSLLVPGALFLMDFGDRQGHAGIVTEVNVAQWRFAAVEGNSNFAGSRDGDTVARRPRSISVVNLGFLLPWRVT